MFRLIKFHLAYLFNKVIVILTILLIMLLALIYVSGARSNSHYSYLANIEAYYNLCANMTSLVLTIFSCFIFTNVFQNKNDNYVQLTVSLGESKTKHALTKIVTIMSFMLAIVFSLILIYLLVGFICLKGFTFNIKFISYFASIYLASIALGIESLILMKMVKTNFTFIIVIIIYIALNSMMEDVSIINKILFIVFPLVKINDGTNYHGFIPTIFILLCLLFLFVKLYSKQEIKID